MAAVTSLVIGLGGLALSAYGMSQANNQAEEANVLGKDNIDMQDRIANEQLKFQKEQQVKLDIQKEKYAGMKFKNPYADVQTEFENVYEDLTVNQKQAQFEREMFQQNQADTMQSLKGAAGGSGIAGLAQAMANQGQRSSQQISASIGQQESMNQKLLAQGAIRVQTMETAGEMAKMGGEDALQQAEMSRQATLLGVEMGGMAGANAGVQSAYANQMAAGNAALGALNSQAASSASMGGSLALGSLSLMGSGVEAYTPKEKENECFVGDSKVLMSDGTLKNIQDVRVGSIVQGGHGENVVKKLIKHAINDVYRIYTSGLVNTTADHPLFINNEWTSAEELGWNSVLTYVDNLYNLETESTFVVDGVIASGVLSEEFKQI